MLTVIAIIKKVHTQDKRAFLRAYHCDFGLINAHSLLGYNQPFQPIPGPILLQILAMVSIKLLSNLIFDAQYLQTNWHNKHRHTQTR